jgi:hypothetical protein
MDAADAKGIRMSKAPLSKEEMTPCMECAMPTTAQEYHPYAACLMFKGCGDADTVRVNLDSVIARGYQMAWEENPPVRPEDVR